MWSSCSWTSSGTALIGAVIGVSISNDDDGILIGGSSLAWSPEFFDDEAGIFRPVVYGDSVFAAARLTRGGQLDGSFGAGGVARATYANGINPGPATAFAKQRDDDTVGFAAYTDRLVYAQFTPAGDVAFNRSASIEDHCVWKSSGSTLTFNEVELPELSTVDAFSGVDQHAQFRERGTTYEVSTISLNDLLAKHGAPEQIDYLSIDTEGSEFEILQHLDFGRYSFRVITCEHNFTPMREKLHELLTGHGYARRHEDLSKFDDWYVRPN